MYIQEAHTIDGWQTESNEAEAIRLIQHTTLPERIAAARLCARELALTIPTLVDPMDDPASTAFAAWPERIYIATPEASVHYVGGPGPDQFDVSEARRALDVLVEEGRSDLKSD